ncbi:uncharacterized protein [Lepeophtheirus salmonis]|uniref:uncharacterized protein isoform X3 n=1 Tax=Lepeophtheirus salmonis TaxID=72036 RepID=UPI003AF33C5B
MYRALLGSMEPGSVEAKSSSTSPPSTSNENPPNNTSSQSELVEFRMDTGRVINFKSLEPPQQQPQKQPDTYHVSAAGVAFVPFMPKSEQPPNDKSGFVTINASALKTNHHLLVEGPSSLEPSHIEHLINSAQLTHVERSSSSSSSWMSST